MKFCINLVLITYLRTNRGGANNFLAYEISPLLPEGQFQNFQLESDYISESSGYIVNKTVY
jgi:hypothetical protein